LLVFGWSVAVAVLVLGVGAAAAVGWLTKDAAAYLMLGCIVVGAAVIGRKFRRALLQQQPPKNKPADAELHPADPFQPCSRCP